MIKIVLMGAALSVGAAWVAADQLRAGLPGQNAVASWGGGVKETRPGAVSLAADRDGHFRVNAIVDGHHVPMMVDTGATVVALSYDIAERLGLTSGPAPFDARVSTANGTVGARRVVLREVQIGSVRVPEVSAVILPRGAMDGALLGMSFLGRLRKLETAGGQMTMVR